MIYLTIWDFYPPFSSFLCLCRYVKRSPPSTRSVTMQIFCGCETTPIIKIMLGCRSLDNMLTSLLISSIKSGVRLGLKIFFIATLHPRYVPLCTILNPPWEIGSLISRSLNSSSEIGSNSGFTLIRDYANPLASLPDDYVASDSFWSSYSSSWIFLFYCERTLSFSTNYPIIFAEVEAEESNHLDDVEEKEEVAFPILLLELLKLLPNPLVNVLL